MNSNDLNKNAETLIKAKWFRP